MPRQIVKMLNAANTLLKESGGYWDFERMRRELKKQFNMDCSETDWGMILTHWTKKDTIKIPPSIFLVRPTK